MEKDSINEQDEVFKNIDTLLNLSLIHVLNIFNKLTMSQDSCLYNAFPDTWTFIIVCAQAFQRVYQMQAVMEERSFGMLPF